MAAFRDMIGSAEEALLGSVKKLRWNIIRAAVFTVLGGFIRPFTQWSFY